MIINCLLVIKIIIMNNKKYKIIIKLKFNLLEKLMEKILKKIILRIKNKKIIIIKWIRKVFRKINKIRKKYKNVVQYFEYCKHIAYII